MNAPSADAVQAARAYELLFVPAVFGEWAPRMCDAARLGVGDRVLDVACGTGVLAREARARVDGRGGAVAGLDPDAGMLAVAAEVAGDIEWVEGVAEELPWPDGTFDAVLSQFGLMFFRDREAALAEAHRVLRADGRLAIAVWDALERTPAYAAEVALLEREAGARAADALRAPFVLGDREDVASMLADAGFVDIAARRVVGCGRFPSVRAMVEADLRGWLPVMGVELDDATIGRTLDAAADAMAAFTGGDGAVAFDSPAHLIAARKPSLAPVA